MRLMSQPVLREKGRRYVGLPEFVRVGEQILAEMGLEQERGTVTSVPDERTIRYYMAEGLIQTPGERQGTASVFLPPALRTPSMISSSCSLLPATSSRILRSGKCSA